MMCRECHVRRALGVLIVACLIILAGATVRMCGDEWPEVDESGALP